MHSSRLAGAAGALLLQAGFLFLFLYSMPQIQRPVETAREMILIFRRALPPPPLPAAQPKLPTPAQIPSQPPALFAPPPIISVPPSFAVPDLKGFGAMLNDCALEIYYRLTPENRARCPRPGEEGATVPDDARIEIAPRTHAKDAAIWQEDWDEKHWTAGLCDPGMGLVALCQMHQAIAEHERAADVRYHLAKTKTDALKPPKPQVPAGARAPKN